MKKSHNDYATETFTGDVIDSFLTRRSIGGLLASKSTKLMLEDAMLEAGQNRCRALLAKNALEDTGAMAFMVGRLSHMAPAGREYYQKILKAYAETTARQIEEWGRY